MLVTAWAEKAPQNLILKDTETQTMLVTAWAEKAPQKNHEEAAASIKSDQASRLNKILDNLKEVQNAVKEDPTLNKKVLEGVKAYTKSLPISLNFLPWLRIEQYFQAKDYALSDVIENGNSFKPVAQTTTNDAGTLTTLIPGPYKDAKTLFGAIQTRFGGNEATKKTQKTLLKKILPFEWNTHLVVWRNKLDLDIMSFDDLYNNFKIVEQEVKGTASSSSSSNSHNMAFVSSPSSTNEVNTTYGVSTANSQANHTSTQVSTANLIDATVYAFLASQLNGSQLVHEDLVQIYKDDLERMNFKWSDTAGYNKSKVECFNFRKLGHFARECRQPRNQESKNWNQDSSRRIVNVEDTSSNAMNRVLVVKPHSKTPYELFRVRTPALSFMRPFGCHVIILNTLDHLGKSDRKPDEGFFVRCSLNSDGPKWLFDIDVLTKSMNYVPVVADLPKGKKAIGIKWVFRNKKDERGIVIKTKQGFMVYQMDVKSAFLYEMIEEEVYMCQPLGFKDHDHPDKKELCVEFKRLMKDKFQMSSMGELTLFLGLQVKQKKDGIFISQDKYVVEALRKFNFSYVKFASTAVDTENTLVKDADSDDVYVHLYRSMIGSLMYLTASRPNIIDSLFELVAYTDSDYAGKSFDRKSTTRGCQFLESRLIAWQCKKQTMVATSTIEAEYVAVASCCGQVLWIHNQILDYGLRKAVWLDLGDDTV
nr:copia protein [Tanacetum cinerariifolium]